MNVFPLSRDPREAAIAHYDAHVKTMPSSLCQIAVGIALAHSRSLRPPLKPNGKEFAPLESSWFSHPWVYWAADSQQNYEWLCDLVIELCDEHYLRFGKDMQSRTYITWAKANRRILAHAGLTPFPVMVPAKYRWFGAVTSYRLYYAGAKERMAKWTGRTKPKWWGWANFLAGFC